MPEELSAWVLHSDLWAGVDCGALSGELVFMLLRRDRVDGAGVFCSAAEIVIINLSRREYTVVKNFL